MQEVIADRIGSLFREPLVHRIAAHAVGVAFDGEPEIRVGQQDSGYFREFLARSRTKRGFARVKHHIRQVHDEASGGVPCGDNEIELLQQFGAQGFAIPHGLLELLIRGRGREPIPVRVRLGAALGLLRV